MKYIIQYIVLIMVLMILVACAPTQPIEPQDNDILEPQETTPPAPQDEPPEYSPVDDRALTGEQVDMGNEDSY